MKRIVSVALPHWPIERHGREQRRRNPAEAEACSSSRPFALVESGYRGGVWLAAVNLAAQAAGIQAGDALADARAILPALAAAQARPVADRDGLRRLAFWLGRYAISRNAYGLGLETSSGHRLRCYGLWADISGVAHLYGGEAALMADLEARLAGFGLTARAALADTLGAAHALAWHGPGGTIAQPGETLAAIAKLPVSGLRLERARVQLLHRLGFKEIGGLASVPRTALERRFPSREEGHRVLLRLDQALGVRPEPRRPLVEAPVLAVHQPFAEPLISSDGLACEVEALAEAFCSRLGASGQGVRAARLSLYRCDGTVASVHIATSGAARDAGHLTGLLAAKLATVDLGFGVDLLALEALAVEPFEVRQDALTAAPGGMERAALQEAAARLIDRLANRLATTCVTRLAPARSHWPERSEVRDLALAAPQMEASPAADAEALTPARPAILLAEPEPIAVMAAIPEGAPVRFVWRRAGHRIVRAEGPERIEPEWWRETSGSARSRPRDYYALEDDEGARFWVFRAGRYDQDCDGQPPAWFIHGVFA